MNKQGPILTIDDDTDCHIVLASVFQTINYHNEIIFFYQCYQCIEISSQMFPFIILSDINLPAMNGFELRHEMPKNEAVRKKYIPFIFFSTAGSKDIMHQVFEVAAQGFFTKPFDYTTFTDTIKNIIDYWQSCYTPA